MTVLNEQRDVIRQAAGMELAGTVTDVKGLAVRVAELPAPIGASVKVQPAKGGMAIEGEVVGFDAERTIVMPMGVTAGIRRGDRVVAGQFRPMVRVSEHLQGRVLDGAGMPMDGKGPVADAVLRPLRPLPVDPLKRPPIKEALGVGVRAIDAMITAGRGQRLGVFASPGLGKSTLLGMMARHTEADVSVIALVGERGREVRQFLEEHLGVAGRSRSVVVCATSDQSPVLRVRAAMVALTVAEFFRDRGRNVLLIMDSLTRFCQAQRQVGLSADEPPATKGYPPSVFAMLPGLLERCGATERGSITGFFAVLTELDETADPVADAARGVLDGHVQLSGRLARAGHWPAIDVLGSISRVADDVTDKEHREARRRVVKLLSAYQQVEDLLSIGAYAAGSNPDYDLAIACKPAIDRFLQQGEGDSSVSLSQTRKELLALVQHFEQARKQMAKGAGSARVVGPR